MHVSRHAVLCVPICRHLCNFFTNATLFSDSIVQLISQNEHSCAKAGESTPDTNYSVVSGVLVGVDFYVYLFAYLSYELL